MTKTYRSGALGALLDEYERAASEFAQLLSDIPDAEFQLLRDRQTQDEHCRSIQTIANHVVRSGYGYADYIRQALSLACGQHAFANLSRRECLDQLQRMLEYTAETLNGRWHYSDEQIMAVEIRSRWGPHYDLEQILEHAIVHTLRHRRQIERFRAQEQSMQ